MANAVNLKFTNLCFAGSSPAPTTMNDIKRNNYNYSVYCMIIRAYKSIKKHFADVGKMIE
jgi:hypothetical protein